MTPQETNLLEPAADSSTETSLIAAGEPGEVTAEGDPQRPVLQGNFKLDVVIAQTMFEVDMNIPATKEEDFLVALRKVEEETVDGKKVRTTTPMLVFHLLGQPKDSKESREFNISAQWKNSTHSLDSKFRVLDVNVGLSRLTNEHQDVRKKDSEVKREEVTE